MGAESVKCPECGHWVKVMGFDVWWNLSGLHHTLLNMLQHVPEFSIQIMQALPLEVAVHLLGLDNSSLQKALKEAL